MVASTPTLLLLPWLATKLDQTLVVLRRRREDGVRLILRLLLLLPSSTYVSAFMALDSAAVLVLAPTCSHMALLLSSWLFSWCHHGSAVG